MGEVFSRVVEMSLYGSIAILAVLLFRLIFKNCPKKILILFWAVVAIRLIIPFNFNSPTSILNIGQFFVKESAVSETQVYDPETRLREITTVRETVPAETADTAAVTDVETVADNIQPEAKTSNVTFKTVIPYIWLAVTAGMLVFSAVRYAIFYSKARWSSRSFDGRYYMANDIDSPFVVGVINPKIFFPINMDDDEREYVLNHEWTHIKYKDGLTKLLSYIVLCIHWFNPLVWLAFFMLCADIEMRVDEETTSYFDLSMVKEYCKSLVRHAAADSGGAFMQSTAFSGLRFGGMETKLRIKNLLNSKITSVAVQIVSVAVTLIFALLVSAASVNHRNWEKEAPVVTPETSEKAASSESSSETSEESSNSGKYEEAYLELIEKTGQNKNNFKYDLIYVNDDMIPELVIEKTLSSGNDAHEVNLYTFKDGVVVPVFEGAVYFGSGYEAYNYLPCKDYLCYRNMETDVEWVNSEIYTMDGLINGDDPVRTGVEDYPVYYVDGVSASMDEFMTVFCPDGMTPVIGILSYWEMTDILQSGNIPARGTGSANANNTPEVTATPTATPSATPTVSPTPVPVETKPSITEMQEGTIFTFDGKFRNPQLDCMYGSFDITASASDRIKVIYNGKVYELSVRNSFPSMYLNTAYLAKVDGEVYLYVALTREIGSSEACDLDVYRVTDDSITFVGVCEGLIVRSVTSTNEIFCYEDTPYGSYLSLSRNYRMCSGGLMEPSDNVCELFPITSLTVTKPVTGFVVRDGRVTDEEKTISAGELAIPVYVNVSEYIDIKDYEGNIIRVDFVNEYNTYYSADNPRWVYSALDSLFIPQQ